MIQIQMPDTETDNLATTHQADRFEARLAEAFEDIARLAAQVCETPIAAIALKNGQRYWFKSKAGVKLPDTNQRGSNGRAKRSQLQGNRAKAQSNSKNRQPNKHWREVDFQQAKEGAVVFSFQIPFYTAEGHELGSLCVMDCVPRQLNPEQEQALRALTRLAVAQLSPAAPATQSGCELALAKSAVSSVPDAVPDAAVLWFSPDSRIVGASEAACRYFGYSRAEIFAKSAADFDPEWSAEWEEYWRALKQRGSFTFQSRHRIQNGQRVPVELTVHYVELEGHEYCWAEIREQPDRHESSSRLPAGELHGRCQAGDREEMARSLLNASRELAVLVDTKGTILLANETAASVFGVSRDALTGACICDFLPEPMRSQIKARLEEGISPSISVQFFEERQGDCSHYFTSPIFDAEGHLSRLAIFARYHSECLRDRASRTTSEEIYRLAIANITEAVFITDDSGAFTFICPNAEHIFGYTVPEIEALGNISQLLGENLFEQKRLEQTGEIHNIEREITDARGDRHTVLVNVKRVAIQEGKILYTCRDITESANAQAALFEERECFRLLVENVKDYAIFMLNPVGEVVSWNPGAETITGYLSSEIIGQHFSCFYTREDIEEEVPWKALRLAAIAGRLQQEGWCVRHDGSRFWGEVAISAYRDKFGYLRGFSVVTRDFTERKQIEEKLWHAAFHDPLTGLPNRAFLTERLWEAVERSQHCPDYQFAVLFLDCDGFKLINDSLGHSTGDRLLVALALRLLGCLRPKDTVARLGGDEFAILLDGIRDGSDALLIAEQIHAALKSPFDLNGHEVFATTSIGIALGSNRQEYPEILNPPHSFHNRPEELLRDAGTAMCRAKSKGRARHEVFNAAMHAAAVERLQLETDLRHAIEQIVENEVRAEELNNFPPIDSTLKTEHSCTDEKPGAPTPHSALSTQHSALNTEHSCTDEKRGAPTQHPPLSTKYSALSTQHSALNTEHSTLSLHYQPIVALDTGRLAGFEALVRWHHPRRGFISPSEFIPVAEDTGLIVPLGAWVLREACRQLRQWQEKFPTAAPLTVNVNLSSKQLAFPNLIEQIDRILLETDLDASSLKLEITESFLMENAPVATEILEQLRARNIQLCIDDFGTGYSSLSYLRSLPVSTLKIDRSFVSRMGEQDENFEIVRAIIMLY